MNNIPNIYSRWQKIYNSCYISFEYRNLSAEFDTWIF